MPLYCTGGWVSPVVDRVLRSGRGPLARGKYCIAVWCCAVVAYTSLYHRRTCHVSLHRYPRHKPVGVQIYRTPLSYLVNLGRLPGQHTGKLTVKVVFLRKALGYSLDTYVFFSLALRITTLGQLSQIVALDVISVIL